MQTKPLKICMIFPAYAPGSQKDGIGDYTRILTDQMRKREQDVSVIASRDYSGSDGKVFKLGRSDNWGFSELVGTLKIIKKHRFDVAHMQYTPVSYGFGVAFKFLPLLVRITSPGTLFVTTFHTLVGGRWISRINALLLSAFSHRLISTHDGITRLFARWLPFCMRKLYQAPIFPNIEMYDIDRLEASGGIRRKYNIPQDAVIVGNFGFIYPGKGIEDLIAALKKLEDSGKTYYLVLIGASRKEQGEYRRHIKEIIRTRGIGERVIWTGELSGKDLAGHLVACDIYAAPYSDGISSRRGSLMAAVIYGLAVVSTRPEVKDLYFRHKKNVFLAKPGDPSSLAAAIRELACDGTLRKTISSGIRELSGEFSSGHIADLTMDIYTGNEKSAASPEKGGLTFREALRYLLKQAVETVEFIILRAMARIASKVRGRVGARPTRDKVLLIQLNSIGDAVMSMPALEALIGQLGWKDVYVASSVQAAPIFRNVPGVRGVYEITPRFWRGILSRPRDVMMSIRSIKMIRSVELDACIDIGGTPGSMLPAILSGAPVLTGPAGKTSSGILACDNSIFFDRVIPLPEGHISDRYLSVVGCRDSSPVKKDVIIRVPLEKAIKAGEYMKENGLEPGAFAVIHPGAKWPPKRWPEGHFADLIKALSEVKGLRTVLTGSPGDRELLSRIAVQSGKGDVIVATDLGILDTAALIAPARVFIGNDSGPAHIAAAVGAPTVIIFGPTEASSCAPVSGRAAPVEASISCRPCIMYFRRDRCQRGENICMKNISPGAVLKKLEEVLCGECG